MDGEYVVNVSTTYSICRVRVKDGVIHCQGIVVGAFVLEANALQALHPWRVWELFLKPRYTFLEACQGCSCV